MTNADIDAIQEAADLIAQADSVLITAGADMGVDSGLPDFRGNHGFWNAYSALGRKALGFQDMANPDSFTADPHLAWGFYGHRLQLYRDTVPHAGFRLLRLLGRTRPHRPFVYTSNVDGQFEQAGFAADRIVECHGSIHYFQCLATGSNRIWPANDTPPEIDETHCRLLSPLPACELCGALARPNVLMFDDWTWILERMQLQHARLQLAERPVVIEIGAGTAIPAVRRKGESLRARLIRINLREAEVHGPNEIGIALGALDALRALQAGAAPRI